MIPEQKIEIKWNPNNRTWFESKGYIFSKYRQPFLVNPFELSPKSNKRIKIICDYCNGETERPFCDYTDSITDCVVQKDACSKCKHIKSNEIIRVTYGVEHQSQIESVIKKIADSEKLDYEFVKNEFDKLGYHLVDTEYINAKSNLKYICNSHSNKGVQTIRYDNLKTRKTVCRYCLEDTRVLNNTIKYKPIVEARGYIFIKLESIKKKIVLSIQCPKHINKGIQKISASDFKKYTGCSHCGDDIVADLKRNTPEKVLKQFESRNYKLLNIDEYQNISSELIYICRTHPDEGVLSTNFAYIRSGVTCPKCNYDRISGDNHYYWKGGISPLQNHLRDKINIWKSDSLKAYGYKCAVSGSRQKLIVHHVYSFSRILEETLSELDLDKRKEVIMYSIEELNSIESLFLDKHYEYGLGVPLHADIHKEFHRLYGRGNNNVEQFDDFKTRYTNGEFDSQLEKVI